MAEAFESSQTWGLYVDPFTEEQMDLWNLSWGTSFKVNTLKSAMNKFQDFKSCIASAETWFILDEDSDPITKLICAYRNTMVIGRHTDVFNVMLEEAIELFEGFGVDTDVKLDRNPLKVDNDAVLADYVVAMKLLARRNMHKSEWENLAGHQMVEISLREYNGTWSGPSNSTRLPLANTKPLTTDLGEWNTAYTADHGIGSGNPAPPQQDDTSYATLSTISRGNDMNDNALHRPAKRHREDEPDTEADFGETSRPTKRLRRDNDQPRAIVAERASAALQQFGIVLPGSLTGNESHNSRRPSQPAESFTSRSNHPRAGIAEAGSTSQQPDPIFSIESQLETESIDGNWEEYHEDDQEPQNPLPPREISPFFLGEEDEEL